MAKTERSTTTRIEGPQRKVAAWVDRTAIGECGHTRALQRHSFRCRSCQLGKPHVPVPKIIAALTPKAPAVATKKPRAPKTTESAAPRGRGFGAGLYAAILAMGETELCATCNCYTWRDHVCDPHWMARQLRRERERRCEWCACADPQGRGSFEWGEWTSGPLVIAKPGHVELSGDVWESTEPAIPEPICEAVAA